MESPFWCFRGFYSSTNNSVDGALYQISISALLLEVQPVQILQLRYFSKIFLDEAIRMKIPPFKLEKTRYSKQCTKSLPLKHRKKKVILFLLKYFGIFKSFSGLLRSKKTQRKTKMRFSGLIFNIKIQEWLEGDSENFISCSLFSRSMHCTLHIYFSLAYWKFKSSST